MKTRYAIIIIVALICATSCRPSLQNQAAPSPEKTISPAIALINRCSSDTSLNTMAYRAAFDTKLSALVVYLGESPEKFSYKWEIPLKEVEKTGLMLMREDYNVSSIALNTIGSTPVVKFYKDGKFKSNSSQFILYLSKCFNSEEKDLVLDKIYQTIVILQKK